MQTSIREPEHLWRIILIEDDADLSQSIAKYLQLDGIEVTGVSTAIDLYREISLRSYAAAIVDLSLPDQDGMVLVQYLRQNTDIRILVLTAHASLENRLAAYQTGADLFLVKPVDFRELSASISNLLSRAETEPSSASPSLSVIGRTWILHEETRELISPKGNGVKLTTKEYLFLHGFTQNIDRTVPRDRLLDALGYQRNEYGHRALETIVHRLRKKTLSIGTLPLRTDHGSGYSFTGPLQLS
ncbi:MAG: response regulator transcription factor [Chlorobium sp.]|uniref:response regulator transcription factor n=1 Tax=Chlorobium sp. TaxID=1095 RepID=UPI0025C5D13E|nr:response regulator transcription factor [Chlorobium sp.]MCF8382463.1 response regulator transcription factor [Chlorobium sp.]